MRYSKFITQLVIVLFTLVSIHSCSKEGSQNNGAYLDYKGGGILSQNAESSYYGGEGYNEYEENPFVEVSQEPISTFSIDADGGSYSNVRRFINSGQLPPKDAVRTEELINYFRYDYPDNNPNHPISLNGEISSCPWNFDHKLIRIGIKGKSIPNDKLPNTNFVFLVDVSGSMSQENKLGLFKKSFSIFVDHMRTQDKVAIVSYSGSTAIVLESTSGIHKTKIKHAINTLKANGSTAGAAAIVRAYDIATQNFIVGGNNRIVMATDGDFNVGLSSEKELVELIEEKRETGVFLSILGFGTGNYQDGKMEQLANNGNGNYEYIDNIMQGEKVFVTEFSKFFTVAKDVKIQVEFNPNKVQSYRLIGYENRVIENEDFEDDKKDAGEIGAGQEITALYEILPKWNSLFPREALTIDFRYKQPDSEVSIPITLEIIDQNTSFQAASESMRFAVTAAGYGMLLRDSQYKGTLDFDKLINWSNHSTSYDPYGYKEEFKSLILISKGL